MTRKSMWKRVVVAYTNRWGDYKVRVIPKRHGKRYKTHKRAREEIRPGGRMLG